MTEIWSAVPPKRLVIECFYYPECSSHEILPQRLDQALTEEGVQAEVHHHTLSIARAHARGIEGSPTVLINGTDILAAPSGGGT